MIKVFCYFNLTAYLFKIGIFKDVQFQPFWFASYVDVEYGEIFSTTPVSYEPMNQIVEFSTATHPNVTELDPFANWCVKAWALPTFTKFNYTVVRCDDPDEKSVYNLCFRAPMFCNSTSETPAPRKKRQGSAVSVSLDSVFIPARRQELDQNAARSRASFLENFRRMNLEKSYKSLFEILWYTQLPCFDVQDVTSKLKGQFALLKSCFWKGVDVPCSKIFTTFPTDRGMCCTFNMHKAEEMFKQAPYQEIVKHMQDRDFNKSFDKASMGSEKYDKPLPNMTPEAGKAKGLTLILDAHTNFLTGGSVAEDFDGFHAIIDANDQYPMSTRKTVLLRPGHNNVVSVSALKVTASEDISSVDPKLRMCLFHNEMKMEVHRNYTQANCILECGMRHAIARVR